MHHRTFTAVAIAAFGFAASGTASAQTTTSPTTSDTWRMPYQSGFWGNAGLSFGQSKFKDGCAPGFACDDKDQAFRLYAGGRFNNAVGLEAGVFNLGKFQLGGGGADTKNWGVDLALVAGIPIGANSAIFGKLGLLYGRTKVEGSPAAPGLATGKESGFGPRFGIGGQLGLTPQWALRADWDRFRIPTPGDKEDIDTLMLGVQYTFR